MTADQRMRLEQNGIEADAAIARFMGNEEMYVKFLKKFCADENYQKLCSALEAQNTDEAMLAAHTMKGLCANLSLMPLYQIISKEVEYLRSGDIASAKGMHAEVADSYQKTLTLLQEI